MSPARTNEPPTLRLRSPEHTARILRRHFARHNGRVLLFALATFVATAALWLIAYAICCWLLVLAMAAVQGSSAALPRGFGTIYIVAASCAVFYAWIDRRLTPNDRPRDDKRFGETAADFLLAVPRMTLSIGGTLAAWQSLSHTDLAQAATFLHHLAESAKLPMSGVRLEIPDPAAATRILFALQITNVIDAQRDGSEFWLKLNPLRPETLRLTRGTYAHP